MMNTDVLITVLSWEDRFFLGLEKNLIKYNPRLVLVFKYNNPLTENWKTENYNKIKDLLGDKLKIVEITPSIQSNTWFTFKDIFVELCKNKKILIDITTMTREAIWLSLFNCKINNCETSYIYYKPQSYSGDWISRNAGKPRLLYKMSGVAKLGTPTLLVITGGYDIQRLDNLIFNFEPLKTLLFLQDGKDDRNVENFEKCIEILSKKYNITPIKYDAYDVESSFEIIIRKLETIESSENTLENYNIILNSLGAKISAITLFKIWLKYPQIALSYIPSREYNKNYSSGIGEVYEGHVSFV